MESSLYVATAAQRVLQKQLITVANNVANSTTVGFRAENVNFDSLVSNTSNDPVHFPVVGGLYASTVQGTLIETGNPLDVALSGDGMFAISTPVGVAYTRDGRLQISPFGEIQTLEGHSVLDTGEAPIQIDASSGPPTIHNDGRITLNGRLVANIGVFDVDPKTLVSRYSNSAFFTSVPGVALITGQETTVTQGFVEGSNVNPVKELASLMTITQSFESATSIISRADDTLSKAINELGGR